MSTFVSVSQACHWLLKLETSSGVAFLPCTEGVGTKAPSQGMSMYQAVDMADEHSCTGRN